MAQSLMRRMLDVFSGKPNLPATMQSRSLEDPAVPLTDPIASQYLSNAPSMAGVIVDRVSVLGYPAVWRAINLGAGKMAKLKRTVYKKEDNGGRIPDTKHPAYKFLRKKPSDLYTPFVFWKTMFGHSLLHGNGYAYLFRDTLTGEVEDSVILDPQKTGVVWAEGKLRYFTHMGNQTLKILPENMLHIKGLSHDGIVGHDVLSILRTAFGVGLAAQNYAATFYKNDGSPGFLVLKWPGNPKDKEGIEALRKNWGDLHTGIANKHRLAVLTGGADLVNLSVNHEQTQFIETRQYEIACSIANIFGTPAHKLGVKDGGTAYNSLEQEDKAYLNDYLDDWITSADQECEVKLLSHSQYYVRDTHFIETDRRALEQADTKTKHETTLAQLNGGGITYNQYACEHNLPSIGPEGDRLRCPVNITFLDLIGQQKEQSIQDESVSDDEHGYEDPAEGNPNEKQKTDTDPIDNRPTLEANRYKQLLSAVIKRNLTRLNNAMNKAHERGQFDAFNVIEENRSVIIESMPSIDETTIDRWLNQLAEECQSILREQLPEVFNRDYTERFLS